MATVPIRPVIPTSVSRSEPARRPRRPLPVAGLAPPPVDAEPAVYALSAVDKSGRIADRIADRSVVRALGWCAGTQLDIRSHRGLITIRPADDGVHRVDDRGHLHLPLTARRWCHLHTGDRVLLAANPAAGVVVAYPLPVLDRILALGGDAA